MTTFQDHIQLLSSSMLKIERLWELKKFEPNDEQREAILHVDGPLFLTAGPGSGKTRVLLWRTVNLIVFHGVKPEEIFLSTFTEKAAHQLKEGLRSLLGLVTNINGQPYDLSQMYIGTVHSLCQRILSDRRHFSVDRHRNRPPQLLDDLGQYFHLSRNRNWNYVIEHSGLSTDDGNLMVNQIWEIPSVSKHVAVINARSVFNRFSEECIDSQRALHSLALKKNEFLRYWEEYKISPEQIERLIKLYSAYLESLQATPNARLTDFALLQQEAYRVLESYEASKSVFKHVIVDEYQDTNTIQEKIFFKLASGTNNICVVGDDDQALYRFRGATVENFVEFPSRCQQYLELTPRRISLDTNYRSREGIVNFYTSFIRSANWRKPSGGEYRVADKAIQAHRKDSKVCVIASTPEKPDWVAQEIAHFVRQLIDERKVENPNQIAFLFPSMKYQGDMVASVQRMKEALEAAGLQVYAPRAGRFLEVNESFDIFGLMFLILGRPPAGEFRGHDYDKFMSWVALAEGEAHQLVEKDQLLKQYVHTMKAELENSKSDFQALLEVVNKHRWDLNATYDPNTMKRHLHGAQGLSEQGQKLLVSSHFDRLVRQRAERGQPVSLLYILKRATSIGWNLLDLFYRLCGFEHFKRMFDVAERNGDEGPVANLGLITQYLARFVDERVPLITADLLVEKVLQIVFYSYLFSLYRLGETEIEDVDDPFPKGRIPFLTIHQAKGLEFPVVVLGNLRKDNNGPNRVEQIVQPLMEREPGEPLDRMTEFDIMRMFYVALSRAKNLLVLAHFKGSGQRINEPFKTMLDNQFPRIGSFDLSTIPTAEWKEDTLPKSYSFTSDFLMYHRCPRQYMIFRKFGFVPSRSQTMFFGSLVHRTLEDLHHELIQRRTKS
jgi:DNA helicase II / ATP-dependent DNA helicase PcrA